MKNLFLILSFVCMHAAASERAPLAPGATVAAHRQMIVDVRGLQEEGAVVTLDDVTKLPHTLLKIFYQQVASLVLRTRDEFLAQVKASIDYSETYVTGTPANSSPTAREVC